MYLTIFGHVLKRGVLDEFELVTFFGDSLNPLQYSVIEDKP